VALDLQGLYKSALLVFAGRVKKRLGFDVSSLKEPGASYFYTGQVSPQGAGHVVKKNLALAAALGAKDSVKNFCLPTTAEDESYVEEQLQKEGAQKFFVISPGGGWGSKCWPVERYVQLHNAVTKKRGWRCFLNIGPGEESLREEFLTKNPSSPPVTFPLTLRQLVALLKRAKVFVSGDTGPLHLAAAVGTPVVALFGPTDPARNGPYAKDPSRAVVLHHNELGIRTYKHESGTSPAMLAISVEEARDAVDRVLEASGE
jgi:ADP-heptose:LPS heptosyltransferase